MSTRREPFAVNNGKTGRQKSLFHLCDDYAGLLHKSGLFITTTRKQAWIGPESQIFAIRKEFPWARNLHERIVI